MRLNTKADNESALRHTPRPRLLVRVHATGPAQPRSVRPGRFLREAVLSQFRHTVDKDAMLQTLYQECFNWDGGGWGMGFWSSPTYTPWGERHLHKTKVSKTKVPETFGGFVFRNLRRSLFSKPSFFETFVFRNHRSLRFSKRPKPSFFETFVFLPQPSFSWVCGPQSRSGLLRIIDSPFGFIRFGDIGKALLEKLL